MSDPTIHVMAPGVTLWHGDCIETMRLLPDASVDAVVTDPPYGIAFMGKQWDQPGEFGSAIRGGSGKNAQRGKKDAALEAGTYDLSAHAMRNFQRWCAEWAAECLRVLKPGGHILAFGGSRTWHRLAAGIEDAGFEIRDSIAWLYGSGFPKSRNVGREVEEFSGWGTALKPAFEPIVVGRKPLIGTIAANVLAHGTGALNIDASRTATTDKLGGGAETATTAAQKGHEGWTRPWMGDPDAQEAHAARVRANVEKAQDLGRWPTNVLLDPSQAEALDAQTGMLKSGSMKAGTVRATPQGAAFGEFPALTGAATIGDSGGASRFFPTFRYEAKAKTAERPVVDGVAHPTVKPIAIMRWLVTLVTPPGGTVLEPFAGSGTTVEACILDGFKVIAVERGDEYLPLIEKRIARGNAAVEAEAERAASNLTLFDLGGDAA